MWSGYEASIWSMVIHVMAVKLRSSGRYMWNDHGSGIHASGQMQDSGTGSLGNGAVQQWLPVWTSQQCFTIYGICGSDGCCYLTGKSCQYPLWIVCWGQHQHILWGSLLLSCGNLRLSWGLLSSSEAKATRVQYRADHKAVHWHLPHISLLLVLPRYLFPADIPSNPFCVVILHFWLKTSFTRY